MAVKLIITADDFGVSPAINAAVLQARTGGLLTSASLMVTGGSVDEAVAIARDDPGLAVGLHLSLSDSRSILSPWVISTLVDGNSHFHSNPARAAFFYYMSPEARRQLRLEIEAQFEAFAATGLPLSHVDGHQHLHAHPAVLPVVVELAEKYGARGIRVPGESLIQNLRVDRSRLHAKLVTAAGHAYLNRVCRRNLDRSSLARCNVCIGSLMSGAMRDDYIINMLLRADAEKIELYFHPSTEPGSSALGPNPGDLQALLSPRLRHFITRRSYDLTTYGGISGEVRDAPGSA